MAAVVTAAMVVTLGALPAQAARPRFSNRIQSLISQMTLDEKLSFVHGGTDPNDLGEAGYLPGVPRLGIPPLRLTDGTSGIRINQPTTVLPAPIALASSFDDQLAQTYGAALGRDGRAMGMDVLLSPMVNTIRVPYGGRNFETFSEDPVLTAHMAGAEVSGIASQGVIPVVKHLAANNQEDDRTTVNAVVDDRALHEVELPGFQAAIDAGAGAVMCSYNRLNGPYTCADSDLLNTVLRDQMDFTGWVMSDWRESLTPDSITDGLDQEMPDSTYFGDDLKTALQSGTIPMSALDTSVGRILTEMARFHLLDQPFPARPTQDPTGMTATALQVAESGGVLLRNSGSVLPLATGSANSVAVIGAAAKTPKVNGGGSSHVLPAVAPTSPVDQITARAGHATPVSYTTGYDPTGEPIPSSAFAPSIAPMSLPAGQEGIVYFGTLTVPTDGDYSIQMQATGGGGFIQVDDGAESALFGDSISTGYTGVTTHLTAGAHDLLVYGIADFNNPLTINMNWITEQMAQQQIADAVAAARAAKTAVVFAYDDSSEGLDRPNLELPGYQDELISAVAAANPRTVVVLNTASAVKMPWLNQVSSVLEMWYPGQDGAQATTALLYGDVNPSGRLTQTFPTDEAHTPVSGDPSLYPGVDDQVNYSEGIYAGYRWYQKNDVQPLFPFGYGLSYTRFAYSGLASVPASDGGLNVRLTVRNTGSRTGTDVPQIYLGPSSQVSVAQAASVYAGSARVTLAPGASKQVTVHIDPQQLSYWDTTSQSWKRAAGARKVWAGSSSSSLSLSTTTAVPR
ncbi:glycoside hydrolase family 3 C-terminal domain-containing protein [Rugosimonospora acidiphila]|uniref:Glycoside hydrolase family 3 C-terminal domain-containing protein n=1 Tax=Rugosimonospora acidiphila TaxID=556531 RepID=A0ABP9SR04_9ACTN